MNNDLYTRKETIRLKGFDYASERVYFVTLVIKDRRKVFVNKELASKTIDCLVDLRKKMKFNLYCYCLMPFSMAFSVDLDLLNPKGI